MCNLQTRNYFAEVNESLCNLLSEAISNVETLKIATYKQIKIDNFFKVPYWINPCLCYDDMICFFYYVFFLLFLSFDMTQMPEISSKYLGL